MKIDIKQLAGDLYTAYCTAVGGKAHDGNPLPSWDEFSRDPAKKKQVDAWVSTALASLRASSAIMRDCFKEWSGGKDMDDEYLRKLDCAFVNADPAVTKYDYDIRKAIQESALKDSVADPTTKPLFEFSEVPPMTLEDEANMIHEWPSGEVLGHTVVIHFHQEKEVGEGAIPEDLWRIYDNGGKTFLEEDEGFIDSCNNRILLHPEIIDKIAELHRVNAFCHQRPTASAPAAEEATSPPTGGASSTEP